VKLKIAHNQSYRFFPNFGSKTDSPQQINCENFIIGFRVHFRAILDQTQVFTTLKGHSQLVRMRIRYHLMGNLHITLNHKKRVRKEIAKRI